MNKSSIEITEQAYLIRLLRDDFDYVKVRAALTRLFESDQLCSKTPEEDDILSRASAELGDRFDHLSDK